MLLRRIISIGAILVALPIWLITLPAWLVIAAAFDLVAGLTQFPLVRLGLYAGAYLVHGWYAAAKAAVLTVRNLFRAEPNLVTYQRTQGWWAESLLRWADRLLGIRIDWDDPSRLPDETFVLLSRHASMADAIVPAALVAGRLDRFVQYVLKQELRWDSSIDLYGTPLRNHFVARSQGRTAEEVAAIGRLAKTAMDRAVLVIFPEGTYATPANRRRVLASLQRAADRPAELENHAGTSPEAAEGLALANELTHLLPPKPAGTLAMLAGAPEADVVVLGHVGLDGISSFGNLRRRLPLANPVRVRWWLHPRADLPTEPAELQAWLNNRWRELDRWVDQNLPASLTSP